MIDLRDILVRIIISLILFYFVVCVLCGCRCKKTAIKTQEEIKTEVVTNIQEEQRVEEQSNEITYVLDTTTEIELPIQLSQDNNTIIPKKVKVKEIKVKSSVVTSELNKTEEVTTEEIKTSQNEEKTQMEQTSSMWYNIILFMLICTLIFMATFYLRNRSKI